jgi:subtilisin family serine protease
MIHRRRPALAGLCLAVALAIGLAQVSRGQTDCDHAPDLLQLVLHPLGNIDILELIYGLEVVDSIPPVTYLVRAPLGLPIAELLELLDLNPLVTVVEFALYTETPEGRGQMMVAAVGGTVDGLEDQEVLERLRVAEAHVHSTGEDVVVAILDTGVCAGHSALAGSVLPSGMDFVDGDADPSDEANGLDDDQDGWIDDGAGHGTMVAGIVHLVAPGADLLPVRVLDDEGRGLTFDVAKGIRYAVDQGARVLNVSLGLDCESEVIARELERAESCGVSIVAAAGNENQEDPALYPARSAESLSIAAVDSMDVKSDFSNFHATVALSAPGSGILAPFHDGGYALGAGTSFASPFVAGAAALVRSTNPALDKGEVDAVVASAVVDIYGFEGNEPYVGKLGTGRLDVYLAWEQTPRGVAGGGGADLAVAAPPLRVQPNPSHVGHAVRFDRPGAPDGEGAARLVILDAGGRRIRTLSARAESAVWDGRRADGRLAGAGAYFACWSVDAGDGRRPPGARFVLLP